MIKIGTWVFASLLSFIAIVIGEFLVVWFITMMMFWGVLMGFEVQRTIPHEIEYKGKKYKTLLQLIEKIKEGEKK